MPGQRERYTIDFVVNGRSLYEWLEADGLVGRFCPDHPGWNDASAKMFLLESPGDYDDWAILFGCHICLDIHCGAVLVKISRVDGGYCWSGFSYFTYDSESEEYLPDTSRYSDIHPLYFSEENYADVIKRAATFVSRE